MIIQLQKTVEGIFNTELEQFKVKSEKTLSGPHTLYEEQIQSFKRGMQNERYNDCKTFRNN